MYIFDELKSLYEKEKIEEDKIKNILEPQEYVYLLHQIKKRLKQGQDLVSAIRSEIAHLYSTPKVPDALIKPLSQITSFKTPVFEGGNMFQDVGKIYKSEILPTLDFINQKIGIDVKGNIIGSGGKNEYSGDLDIGLNIEDVDEFFEKVKLAFGGQNCRKQGKLVSVKVPIQHFDDTKLQQLPRTGFVQVDFFPGEVNWLKFFHHAPSQQESQYKGAHRNLAITSITPYIGRQESSETDDEGRPIELVRYKWSPDIGLVKILRKSIRNPKGGWLKKQEDKNLGNPTKDPNEIANILFHGKFGAEALNSFESIVNAVKKSYDKNTKEEIFRNMARSFKDNLQGYQNWNYPPEIQKYL